MHDFSLGPPVDVGEYDGFMLDDKPIHSGNCEDGVYGCRRCNSAIKSLSDEEIGRLTRDGHPAEIHTTNTCDYCKKEVPFREISGIRAIDEPCYYEICRECRKRHDDELNRLAAEEDDDDWESADDYWDDFYYSHCTGCDSDLVVDEHGDFCAKCDVDYHDAHVRAREDYLFLNR